MSDHNSNGYKAAKCGKRMKAAARVRRCRQRARDGKIVLRVTVELERLRDVLLGADLLKEWDDEDKLAITAAFQRAVELWLTNEERKLGNYLGAI